MQKCEENGNKCTSCGSYVPRRYESEMHAGTQILDGKRVEICKKPREGYRDPIVLDELVQYFNGHLYRLWPSERYFSKGGSTLHRAVWKDAFGEIPNDAHIHHKDNDTFNNRLWNLECLPKEIHLKMPRPNNKGFSEKARDAASDWHRSEAGRLWHKRQAERSKSWLKWKRETKACQQCNKEFEALVRKNGHAQKFCHNNCKATYYRKRQIASRNS